MALLRPLLALALLPLASGCLVRTAANVATLPVRAGGQVIDWTTTSRAEADRNDGRKARRERKRAAQAARRAARAAARAGVADAPYR